MARIIDQLQMDHRNMRLLLGILEEQLDLYSAGSPPDFDLIEQIIDYTLHYPSLIHHPREDLLFRRLLARDPGSRPVIGDLIADHAELAKLVQRLAAAVHNIARDVELPREWFENLVRDYVAKTRQHMEAEERSLFPRLLATLDNSDWTNSTDWWHRAEIRCLAARSKGITCGCTAGSCRRASRGGTCRPLLDTWNGSAPSGRARSATGQYHVRGLHQGLDQGQA
ncbi:MAG: hypothetical protein HC869_07760 [Rhodospirillales bacterium]|nr:hypothetical protein [Rhodospirillales bacterium]